MSASESEDHKAKFKVALEKKNHNSSAVGKKSGSEGSSKLQPSTGKKPKMFRRKSG